MACVYFSEGLKLTQFRRLGKFNSNAVLLTLATDTLRESSSNVRGTGTQLWLSPYLPFS